MTKESIIDLLQQKLEERIATSWKAMQAAQESANEQSKSSAGDKYETGRSMGQLDRSMHARQYEQARQELLLLHKLRVQSEDDRSELVRWGSLVQGSAHDYIFLSISVGACMVEEKTVWTVSAATPLGKMLLGKQVGDRFELKGASQTIVAIY